MTIEQAGVPSPTESDVLIAPTLVGLDWYDAAVAANTERAQAWTPGRTFVGRVEGAGSRATALHGQRVVASPDIVCGACDLCRGGLSAHCRQRALLGSPAHDGCLQDHFILRAMNVCAIADSMSDDHAVFALPLARALQAAWMTHLEGRPYVTVLGRGADAILTAQAMALLNASVRIVTNCEHTLHAADRLSMRHRPLNQVGRRADQDVIVDVSAPGGGLDDALAMARPRGKVVLLRPLAPPAEEWQDIVDAQQVVEKEIELIGCRGARLREAVTMLERAEVNVEGLITQRFKLDNAARAFEAAKRADQMKVVIEF